MTPQEATDKLFAAAKSGDIAAAQAALDAAADITARDGSGNSPELCARIHRHADMVQFLFDAWQRERKERRAREERQGAIATVVACALWAAFLLYPAIRSPKSPAPDNAPLPKQTTPISDKDIEAVEKQLRSVLKNPVLTDQLIERISDSAVMDDLKTDPDIVQNLQKLANAIDRNGTDGPRQSIGQSRGDEDSKLSTHSKRWTAKAVQETGTSRERRD